MPNNIPSRERPSKFEKYAAYIITVLCLLSTALTRLGETLQLTQSSGSQGKKVLSSHRVQTKCAQTPHTQRRKMLTVKTSLADIRPVSYRNSVQWYKPQDRPIKLKGPAPPFILITIAPVLNPRKKMLPHLNLFFYSICLKGFDCCIFSDFLVLLLLFTPSHFVSAFFFLFFNNFFLHLFLFLSAPVLTAFPHLCI